MQLGLSPEAKVQWVGRRGLRWGSLFYWLFPAGVVSCLPQVLVIHLGGNDLGLLKGKALIEQAKEDLQYIWKCWPETWIV